MVGISHSTQNRRLWECGNMGSWEASKGHVLVHLVIQNALSLISESTPNLSNPKSRAIPHLEPSPCMLAQ